MGFLWENDLTVDSCEIGQSIVTLVISQEETQDVQVVVEGRYSQSLGYDVSQVIGEEAEVADTLLHQQLIVSLFIAKNPTNYKGFTGDLA